MSSQDLRFEKAAVLITACIAALGCGDASGAGELPTDVAGSGGQVAGNGVSPVVQPGAAGVGASVGQRAAGSGGSAAGSASGVAGVGLPLAGQSAVAGAGGRVVASAGAGSLGGAGGVFSAGSGAVGVAGTSAPPAAGAGGASLGAGQGPGQGGAGSGGRGATGGAPTFDAVYALITDNCNGCHGLGDGGLTTKTRDGTYQGLVNADARVCSGWKRVVPNKPEQSVLYLAITRTSANGCDPRDMPPGGTIWSQQNIELVKAWIQAGAPNN